MSESAALARLPGEPEEGPGPAHPDAVRDLWLECMKGAEKHGNLEKQKTVLGTSKRGRDIARKQNYFLTRRVYGMPAGYDRIKWNHQDLKGITG